MRFSKTRSFAFELSKHPPLDKSSPFTKRERTRPSIQCQMTNATPLVHLFLIPHAYLLGRSLQCAINSCQSVEKWPFFAPLCVFFHPSGSLFFHQKLCNESVICISIECFPVKIKRFSPAPSPAEGPSCGDVPFLTVSIETPQVENAR